MNKFQFWNISLSLHMHLNVIWNYHKPHCRKEYKLHWNCFWISIVITKNYTCVFTKLSILEKHLVKKLENRLSELSIKIVLNKLLNGKQIIHVNVSYFHRYILDTMAAVSTSCPSSKDTVLALLSREVRFDNVQSQRLKRKQRALGSPNHSGAF